MELYRIHFTESPYIRAESREHAVQKALQAIADGILAVEAYDTSDKPIIIE